MASDKTNNSYCRPKGKAFATPPKLPTGMLPGPILRLYLAHYSQNKNSKWPLRDPLKRKSRSRKWKNFYVGFSLPPRSLEALFLCPLLPVPHHTDPAVATETVTSLCSLRSCWHSHPHPGTRLLTLPFACPQALTLPLCGMGQEMGVLHPHSSHCGCCLPPCCAECPSHYVT